MTALLKKRPPIYGLMAEFEAPTDLIAAIRTVRENGYRRMDAYTPFPIEDVAHELQFRRSALPMLVLFGGITGAIIGFGMQYYAAVISYPLNVGGRPLNSWPAFIPITFEMTILFSVVVAVLGMLSLNGLPMPYHPVFNVPRFVAASHNRFFLVLEARDPRFDLHATRELLQSTTACEVYEVDH